MHAWKYKINMSFVDFRSFVKIKIDGTDTRMSEDF